MTADELESDLMDAILAYELQGVRSVRTFEDDGVLTRDKGLVLTLKDGTEFQITIVRSR